MLCMSNRRFISAVLLSSLFCLPAGLLAAGKCERLVATGNPQSPPYLWRDPQHPELLQGASADLLQHLGRELGVEIAVLDSGTWTTAQDEVRNGRMDLLLDTPLTLPQLEQLDYVHPPAWSVDTLVWVRREQALVYNDWSSLRGYKGADIRHAAGTAEFAAFAKDNLTIETLPSLSKALQALAQGQHDYVLAPREAGQLALVRLGLSEQLQALPTAVMSQALFLGLSHNSACNEPWLRGQLAKKMTELLASGVPAAVLQANLARWQAQQAPAVDAPSQ
jgi:polar amino acid transport system substrate-binding protein